jgi:ribosome maturation factor RimP
MNQTTEQKIANIIQSTINSLGFDLVKVSFLGKNSNMLEILIDRIDGNKVSIADCQIVSKNISILLDVEDIIKSKYYLAVSSAGVERPLLKLEDYNKFLDRDVKIRLRELLNGCSHYQGKIIKTEDNNIYLQVKGESLPIPFDLIKNAHLVLTEEMFKKSLNKTK